jgi:histidyl-tRNA synthetase
MTLSTQPYKGVRDFYPEDMRTQRYIFDTWSRVCESFGYEAYNASVLENVEIYEAKSGQEIVNEEMYTLIDKGERRVALRPEMTPSVSRMVAARRQELPYPLRWYSIPNLFRYDRPQRGRLREHWQLNVDVFGDKTARAEHEIICIADSVMQAFKAKRSMYEIRVNSRKFTQYLLGDYFGLDDVEALSVSKLIDKMHKIERAEFIALCDAIIGTKRENGLTEKLLGILSIKKPEDLPKELSMHSSLDSVAEIMIMLEKSGITNARFDITLMRGFDYYTDFVFEVFDLHPDNNRAMFGGGRYDGLVGMFGVEAVPTVGFGQGDVTMQLFLESHGLLPELRARIDLGILLVGDLYASSQDAATFLRSEEVKVYIDTSGRKIGDMIKAAAKRGVDHVTVLGENEIKSGRYILKNIQTGDEVECSLERMVSLIKKNRG